MASNDGTTATPTTSGDTCKVEERNAHFFYYQSNIPAAQALSKFELGVSLILHNWPALSTAVAEQWGGPESADKRDWFAGAIADFCSTQPLSDSEDVEDMLLQIMEDEYELVVDDGSEVVVARDIMRIRDECSRGDYVMVDTLLERWESKKGKNKAPAIMRAGPQSDDEDSVDDEDSAEEDDVQMTDAPSPRPSKEKTAPEIDDEGFTKVQGKKKR